MSKSGLNQSLNDRTAFWGVKVTPELKYLQQVLNGKVSQITVSRTCFADLLKILTSSNCYENTNDNSFANLESLASSQPSASLYHLTMVYAGLSRLFSAALRFQTLKQEVIRDDLIDFLKLPNDYALDFSSCLFTKRRDAIERCLLNTTSRNASLKTFSWRLDVSVSTSSLNRTLEPSVFIGFILSNGQTFSFELNLATFHLLRFNVTLVLKEMEDLLNRQIFKLNP